MMDHVLARLGFMPHQVSPLDRLAFLGERAMGALIFEPAADIALPGGDVALLTLAREVSADVEDRDIAALTQLAVLLRPEFQHWSRRRTPDGCGS